jgi:predicted negative regulator of RcsB-dependent stress response
MSQKKTDESGFEIIESPEVLAGEISKAEVFFLKNSKVLAGLGGAILLAVVAFAGYRYYIDQQEVTAQTALANVVYDFEADSLQKALNGSGGNEGLLAIADGYKGTDASNLANFYAGVSLLKEGKFDEAISRLNAFSSSDLILNGRAKSLVGDAYMEKGQPAEAVSFYKKAADANKNEYFTPVYLMKLALAQEGAKQTSDAIGTYKRVIDEFPLSSEVVNAKKYIGLLEGQAGK